MPMEDLIAGLVGFIWWKHDNDKAVQKQDEEAQTWSEAGAAKNPDAPRAWNAVVEEWKK